MSAKEVVDRIAAASTLLGHLDGQHHAAVSKAQRDKIVATVANKAFTMIELAEISTAVTTAAFASEDKTGILVALSAKAAGDGNSAAKTGKHQNYENIVDVLPLSVWQALSTEEGASRLFQFATDLGLYDASEPTSANLAILLMVAQEGPEKALQFSQAAKLAHVKSVKAMFNRFKERAVPPYEEIRVLPSDRAELQSQFPETFKRAYSDGPPVPCQIDAVVLETMRAATRMRGTKSMEPKLQTLATTGQAAASLEVQALTNVVAQLVQLARPTLVHDEADVRLTFPPQGPQQDAVARRNPFANIGKFLNSPGAARGSATVPLQLAPQHQAPSQTQLPPQPQAPPQAQLPPPHQAPSQTQKPPQHQPVATDDGMAGCREEKPSVAKMMEVALHAYSGPKDGSKGKGKKKAKKGAKKPKASKAKAKKKAMKKTSDSDSSSDSEEKTSKVADVASSDSDAEPPSDQKGTKSKAKVGKVGAKEKATPSYSHEGSRKQFLARTGRRGEGQSMRFPYSNAGEKNGAEQKAKRFCRKVCQKMGLPLNAKFA